LVVVDAQRTATAEEADTFVELDAADDFEALWTLRAVVAEAPLDRDRAGDGPLDDLAARLRGAGDLALEAGQACPLDVAEPEVRGHLDARLRSGRGRTSDAALALELELDVSGALSTRLTGRGVRVLGAEVSLPEAWAPELPVRGTVTASATGRRMDADSAAGRQRR
jgi:hypothetical protein